MGDQNTDTTPETALCRLCGDVKPYKQLYDLRTNETKRHKILDKLDIMHLKKNNLHSANDDLPKTVCFKCSDMLNKTFKFVLDVEGAQGELRVLLFCFSPEFGSDPSLF